MTIRRGGGGGGATQNALPLCCYYENVYKDINLSIVRMWVDKTEGYKCARQYIYFKFPQGLNYCCVRKKTP